MICIFGTRWSGKTRKLLEISAKYELPIVVPYKRDVMRLKKMTQELNIENATIIPFEMRNKTRGMQKVLVDDAIRILEIVLGCPVSIATFDAEKIDMSKMTFLDMFAEWRRQRRAAKFEKNIKNGEV